MINTKQRSCIFITAARPKKQPFTCDICGQYDISPSVMELTCGQSSKHSYENTALVLCADCADKAFNVFKNYGGY